MRILYVCQSYYPCRGGNENHLQALAEKFSDLGHEVSVFTTRASKNEDFYHPTRDTEIPYRETIGGVQVRRFDVKYMEYKFIYRFLSRMPVGYRICKVIFGDCFEIFHTGPYCPQMTKAMIDLKPDLIVVLNSAGAHGYYAHLAKKKLNCPLIVIPCLHTHQDWVDRPMMYKIMKEADVVVALTDFEKKFIEAKGIDSSIIQVGGLGIEGEFPDVSKYLFDFKSKYALEQGPVIASVGRIVEGKGMSNLIQAMPHVWKEYPTAKLILAGAHTNYLNDLKKVVKKFDSQFHNNIIFIPNFSEAEKICIYQSCDIFALPSRVDSFGIVYLEAWMQGKPVIACRSTPQETLIADREDGLLINLQSPQQLSAAILELCRDNNKRIFFGTKGKLKVLEQYTWEKIIPWFDEIYQRCMS